MLTSNLRWAALAGLGAVVWGFGCSDDFHDVGDAENAGAGGSAGNGGSAGSGGSAADGSGGTSNASTVTHTTGESASGPAVTSTSTTGEVFAPRCNDGLMNGDETDIDCGGAECSPCSVGQSCQVGADCKTAQCVDEICAVATCDDAIRNGDETDIDCGGPDCEPCREGETCNDDADCRTAQCVDEVCAGATCDDGIRNGDETDIDCGGACEPCAIAEVCLEPIDCASGRCVHGQCEQARPELADCGASPAAEVGFATNAGLEGLLVGAWLLCPEYAEAPSEREPAGVVGIEFTSDYHYNYLVEDENGQLVRGEGIDFTGDWYIGTEGESATTGTDLTPILIRPEAGGARTYYRPTFTEEPVQLRMAEYYDLFHSTRYVPVELPE